MLSDMRGFSNGAILETTGSGNDILEYAEKAVWNPNTRQFMFMGAPHYQPHRMVIYGADSNSWSIGPLADPCQATQTGCVSHSYDHNTVDPATGTMYFRMVGSPLVYQLPQGASSWTQLPPVPMSSNQCCGALAWFPERSQLVVFDGDWGIWGWSPASNSWRHLAETNGADGTSLPKLPMASYNNFAHYNPTYNAILFGGTSGGTNYMYKYSADGTFTRLKDAPIPVLVDNGSVGTVMAPDPVSGKFVVAATGNLLYEYDLGSDTWTQKNASSAPPIWGGGGSASNDVFEVVAAPISTYGVIMYVRYNLANSQVYIYKYS